MKPRSFLLIFIPLLSLNIHAQPALSNLVIDIADIRSNSGRIELSFYQTGDQFDNDRPFVTKLYSKKHMKDGKMRIRIKLMPGTWGVAMLDDENANGKMDYKRIGIPKEGFGFSNFRKKILKRPRFEDFQFQLGEDGGRILVQVNYM